MKILNLLRKAFIFSLFISLISVIFLSCDATADLSYDLDDDFTAKYTFYSCSPDESSGYSSVTLSFPIGKTLSASDLPATDSEGFALMKPGYELNGWVFYENPRTFSKDFPANIKTDTGDRSGNVTEIIVTSDSASFYVQKWVPITYNIVFDANGGTFPGEKSQSESYPFVFDEETALPSAEKLGLSRKGYSFNGWALSKNQPASSPLYEDCEVIPNSDYGIPNLSDKKDSTVRLYALWLRNDIKLIFDANGGTGSMSSVEVNFDKLPQNLPLSTLSRDGYTFGGWNTSADGSGTYYLDGESITKSNYPSHSSETVTLYAQWYIVSYIVDFDSKGGSFVQSQIIEWNSRARTPEAPSRTGYDFAGWYTSTDGGETLSKNAYDFETPVSENFVLYAKWNVQSYTVTFVANAEDATGSMNAQIFKFSDLPKNLSENAFSREGYSFSRWNTKPDGSGKNYYLDGTEIAEYNWFTEDVTLYAQWDILTYSVNFYLTDVPSTTYYITHNQKVPEPAEPYRIGYDFAGWYVSSDGGITLGDEYDFESPVTSDIDIYAKWIEQTCTVSYFANDEDATGSMSTQIIKFSEIPVTLNFNEFQKEGYDFISWNTDSEGNGRAHVDSESISFENWQSGILNLYAQWKIKEFTVTFIDLTTGAELDVQTVQWKQRATRPEDPVSDYYIFLGWDSDSYYLSEVDYEFDFSTEIISDTIVYSKWEPKKFTLTFDGNDASSGSMESMEFTYGVPQQLPKNEFTKTGNIFAGWSTSSLASYVTYTDGAIIYVDSDLTLYAKWTQRASFFGESKLQCTIDDENEQMIFEALGSYDVYEWSVDNVRVTTSGNRLVIPYDGEYALNKNHFVLLLGGNSDETWTAESANFKILPGNN
ncbi:InlB B-repeat-containing protein [uncultured Treponema sp.]|uniref:InlB B-repeat-containing protein n=1 Tax=uncultured Treponema sp. TaxID=162155 RepID=UPI0025D3DCC2|nr:InlB B-repeat-containing protein [uncultured Treponema sp.]